MKSSQQEVPASLRGQGPQGSPAPQVEPYSVLLQVVVVQYDRKKYAGALERLLGMLARLDIEHSVLVVDNFAPGDWAHPVTRSLIHIGGDNSGWEFTAFDRGLSYLDKIGARAQVYALVTDAHGAYGEEFLSLIDARLIRTVARQRGAVGWIDAWPEATTLFGRTYRDWIRTSFVLLPAETLPKVRPLSTALDTRTIFSGSTRNPFLPTAPLGEQLQKFLIEWLAGATGESRLEEGWHSQFALDDKSMPFFQAKVSAILREHSFGLKLRAAGIPAYDFRLFKRLFEGGFHGEDIDRQKLSPFEWSNWNAPDDTRIFLPLRSHLDRVEIPRHIVQGGAATFHVEGWILASPQPRIVQLRIASVSRLSGACNRRRDDVSGLFPGYRTQGPGFVIDGTLRDIPVGTHDLALDAGVAGLIDLGTIQVDPLFEFAPRRTAIPTTWPAGQPVPFSIDGDLRTTFRAEKVELYVDGHAVDVPAFLGEPVVLESGAVAQSVVMNGVTPPLQGHVHHLLELRFTLEGGTIDSWTMPITVARTEIPCTLREITIGPFDAGTGLATVKLDVNVYDVSPGDRLILERNGVEVLDAELRDDGAGARKALVTIQRQVPSIPPDAAEFSLVRKRGGQRSLVWKGVYLVQRKQPEIQLEELEVTLVRPEEPPTYRIRVKGWVKNHFLVDCLFIDVGSSRAAVLGMYELRPDVSEALSSPAVSRQGFEETVEVTQIEPGEHAVHIVATQEGGESARVTHRALFEQVPARRFSVASDDLERLVRKQLTNFYSAILLRGTVQLQMDEATVALVVDGRVADETTFHGAGKHEFGLRGVPAQSGEHGVRFVASYRGRPLFETDPVLVSFQRVEPPEKLSQDLAVILDRFDLRSRLIGRPSDHELVSRLVERQPERVGDFAEMVAEAAAGVRAAATEARSSEPTSIGERRRLKVLFATWEVPSRDHGGGVYLRNLLTRLGKLHDITLVHTYGIDEAGQVEALRPHLRRIISVPRTFAPATYRGSGRFPPHLYDVYLPELRRTMELEVASHDYDVVDYEYSAMGPYVIPGPPSVLTVHELGFTALLNSAFAQARPVEAAVPDLDRFLRSFHYFTRELPSICDHLVTLTEEDATMISKFASARVFTNPGGVEVDEWPVWSAAERGRAPVLAFVGNYQHPPNVRAVQYFAREVMPLVLRSYPDAGFVVYGSRMSPAVRELDGENGVRIAGFVDDLRGRLRAATAMVAPIFTGTGQRIKVLEAFGAGALVITTDLGIRGLSAVDGQHYYRANTPEEFLQAIIRAVESPDEAARVARAGQELAGTMHSWEGATRQREAIWFATLTDAERNRTATEDRKRASR